MCRIATWSKSGEKHIEETYGLLKFFDRLEKECGGHGQGLCLVKDGEIIYLNKGLKYTNEMIVKKLQRTDYDHAVYHTRIKSIGAITSKNCHPYRSGSTVLAMNGTESGFASLASMLDITDSEAVLRAAVAFNKDIREVCVDVCNATFVGFYKGKPWLVARDASYSGLQFVKDGDMYVFASTLPAEFKDRKQVSGKRTWYYATDSIEDIKWSPVRDLTTYADTLRRHGNKWNTPSVSPEVSAVGKPVVKTASGWQQVNMKDSNGEVILPEEEYFPGKWSDGVKYFTNDDVEKCR